MWLVVVAKFVHRPIDVFGGEVALQLVHSCTNNEPHVGQVDANGAVRHCTASRGTREYSESFGSTVTQYVSECYRLQ